MTCGNFYNMKRTPLLWLMVLLLIACGRTGADEKRESVAMPAGVDHQPFEALLKKYVDEQGLIDYGAWKGNAADLGALDEYLKQFAATGSEATGAEKAASLTNAYNAFTIRTILTGYPIESIWATKEPFKGRRHKVGGREVSLDDIEHGSLIPLIGYQAHGVLVCAARSCPPLQRFAFRAAEFDEQMALAYRIWLSREDLNRFRPEQKKVEISTIFEWFKEDFEKAGGIPVVLGRYAPEPVRAFAASGDYKIEYLPYDWGLNDQGDRGRSYTKLNQWFDNVFK
ncbi:DUF547 domain-containing protein [soil metagenome]